MTSKAKYLRKSNLYDFEVNKRKYPIVFNYEYAVSIFGIEKYHPFDTHKWPKVFNKLIEEKMIMKYQTYNASEATEKDLLIVHEQCYLDSLKWSSSIARITEVMAIALLPNSILQRKILLPLRMQTGGSVMAGKLAMEYGWSINIGGGFHHASYEKGGGFCVYADIQLLIAFLQHHYSRVKKVMIVDLDAHQGNGYERDLMCDNSVYIFDIYNRTVYPQDGYAKRAIKKKIEVQNNIEDEHYLSLLEKGLKEAMCECQPDFVVYNAGTDVLRGDCLGKMSLTPEGVIQRDELVFKTCIEQKIPICMLLSGGYQKVNAEVISKSILSMHNKGLIVPMEQTSASQDPCAHSTFVDCNTAGTENSSMISRLFGFK